MKTDNSIFFEEKFQEGYSEAIKDVKSNNLIVIENELYELTPRQLNKFNAIRLHGFDQNRWHRSLDFVRKNCNLLNEKTRVFNY